MNRRNIFKFGILVISTGMLTGVGLIVWDTVGNGTTVIAQPPTPTPIVTATTLPTVTLNVPLMLVVEDGEIVFYDQPDGMPKPFTVPNGTLLSVMVLEEQNVNGTEWFLLALTEVEGRGWVRANELMGIHVGPTMVFDRFQFCLGSSASPSGPCGSSLPLSDSEVWLTYHFTGLKRGAVVQTVVVVEGEQYHSAPQTWNGPADGTQLVNLVNAHQLQGQPGLWTVKFYVDGKFVTEASVQIRP